MKAYYAKFNYVFITNVLFWQYTKNKENLQIIDELHPLLHDSWLQLKIKVSFCIFAEAENKENVTQMWKVIYSSLWKWKHSRFCSSKGWLWLYRSHTLSILLDRWIVLHSGLYIAYYILMPVNLILKEDYSLTFWRFEKF